MTVPGSLVVAALFFATNQPEDCPTDQACHDRAMEMLESPFDKIREQGLAMQDRLCDASGFAPACHRVAARLTGQLDVESRRKGLAIFQRLCDSDSGDSDACNSLGFEYSKEEGYGKLWDKDKSDQYYARGLDLIRHRKFTQHRGFLLLLSGTGLLVVLMAVTRTIQLRVLDAVIVAAWLDLLLVLANVAVGAVRLIIIESWTLSHLWELHLAPLKWPLACAALGALTLFLRTRWASIVAMINSVVFLLGGLVGPFGQSQRTSVAIALATSALLVALAIVNWVAGRAISRARWAPATTATRPT